MKKALLSLLILLIAAGARAQVIDGLYTIDSTMIRFTDTMSNYIHDTAAVPLWQMGRTHKSFFTTDTNAVAIMTDTVNHYPVNANNSFTIKVHNFYNIIIDFWHKYETTSGHDGGIVEFSLDTGATWQNLKGHCNLDSSIGWAGMGTKTTNFYTFNDTLATGEPAFSGTSSGQQYSRFQFLGPIPTKSTSGPFCDLSEWTHPIIYIRFRFVSDTTADTLAGWVIDSLKIEHNAYSGAVARINQSQSLPVTPNPSFDGSFTFPSIENEKQYTIEVYNCLGARMCTMPYKRTVTLGEYARGLYFYKVTDGTEYYSGRLLYE